MKNILKIDTNEIIESDLKIKVPTSTVPAQYINVKPYITTSLLADYNKGVKTGKITIIPENYYLSNTSTIDKNWSIGDIYKIDDYVKILNKEGTSYLKDSNGNDIIFQIIGRKVRYDGQILIDLDLRELK